MFPQSHNNQQPQPHHQQQQQTSQIKNTTSCLLELEAADYFKLDPNQVNMFNKQKPSSKDLKRPSISSHEKPSSSSNGGDSQHHHYLHVSPKKSPIRVKQSESIKGHARKESISNSSGLNTSTRSNQTFSARTRQSPKATDQHHHYHHRHHHHHHHHHQVGSSTSSTDSLPSISSSPSVSPSLLCPHLTLNDILSANNKTNNIDILNIKSPHTIGLCAKCRLDPPPNIHSPLSPMFRPSSINTTDRLNEKRKRNLETPGNMKRGYSDHQLNINNRNSIAQNRRKQMVMANDDSLDYYLKPSELRKLQMSPTLRHSVEYIRRNSIEAGRVIRVYKNGRAYDRPLRICIMRGEFSNLNHLLDFINSRQLIPLGARYLFHLDGSLVYSVNELKHGHPYVVSGTRAFDFVAAKILKDQDFSERNMQPRPTEESRSLVSSQNEINNLTDGKLNSKIEQLKQKKTTENSKLSSIKRTNTATFRHNNVSKQRDLMSKQALSKEHQITDTHVMNSNRIQFGKQMTSTKLNLQQQTSSKYGGQRLFNKRALGSRERCNNFASEENLTTINESVDRSPEIRIIEKPTKFSRAKSELGAIPRGGQSKRKKNVTFFDSRRSENVSLQGGSSTFLVSHNHKPQDGAQSLDELQKDYEAPTINTMRSSSDQDQVDSNMKEKDEQDKHKMIEMETNEIGIQVSESIDGYLIDLPIALPFKGDEKRQFLKKGAQGFQSTRQGFNRTGKIINRSGKRQQIVTITERQLSSDELNKFRDLDRGDHHSEKTKIEHEQMNSGISSRGSVVKIAVDTQTEDNKSTSSTIASATKSPLKKPTSTPAKTKFNIKRPQTSDNRKEQIEKPHGNKWQYPGGGRVASASPIERPVSQNEPSESVHARVTTPTPSLSTTGDTTSLTMSYDLSNFTPIREKIDEADSDLINQVRKLEKSVLPIEGKLVSGDYPPNRNFQLTWVNGFSINDKYPENSSTLLSAYQHSNQQQQQMKDDGLLAPANTPPVPQFKPSERFANWISYSKKYFELVYPAGSLVVLWCKITNEQRFYSKHNSSISCLTLASLDPDLAASGQINDSRENVNATVHLWSLKSLSTLKIIEDDSFREQTIFSLELKNTLVDGYELFISARSDKKLVNYVSFSKLNADTSQQQNDANTGPLRGVFKGNKVIQLNQQPLVLMKLSNIKAAKFEPISENENENENIIVKKKPKPIIQPPSDDQMVVIFGRKYFEIWACDRKQMKLTLMQMDNKDQTFADSTLKANSIVRMSPREFLMADSEGRLSLLNVDYNNAPSLTPSSKAAGNNPQKYAINHATLIQRGTNGPNSGVTCLARITGNLFISAHSNCVMRFWKFKRAKPRRGDSGKEESADSCINLSSINLPADLGFICTIIVADYDRLKSSVDLFIISTNNVVLSGSIQLPPSAFDLSTAKKKTGNELTKDNKDILKEQMLQNSSLSVLYEGHETSVMNLVADIPKASELLRRNNYQMPQNNDNYYFTCSIDCKICKWNDKILIWKSMLPSACASLAVHPIGSVLAVGSADGTVYILDKMTGLLISYFPLTPVCINCLSYSIDGALLAAGCANGSIFILPVYDRGLKYKKVSIFQSPHPVISLQFSINNQYILTSVINGSYQELILWDLPNFRYMRDNVMMTVDQIEWFDSICSGSEDVRAIWENANLDRGACKSSKAKANKSQIKYNKMLNVGNQNKNISKNFIVNLSCHRLIRLKVLRDYQRGDERKDGEVADDKMMNLVIASDDKGYLRLFRYPCSDIKQAFYEFKVGSSAVNCCRFLAYRPNSNREPLFVTSSVDGSIFIWRLKQS